MGLAVRQLSLHSSAAGREWLKHGFKACTPTLWEVYHA